MTNLLEIGRAILAQNPVCNSCVGRVVAERSHGLTNAERGHALRTVIAMTQDVPYEEPEEECWVCEGHADRVDEWAERVLEALEGIDFETYQVGSRVPPLIEENDRLLREVAELDSDVGESVKTELNREVGKRVGELTDTTVDFERADVVALLEIQRGTVDVRINPAHVYGRYRKLERGIPQTEWPCRDCGGSGEQVTGDGPVACDGCDGTGYRYDRSVEQLTVPPVVAAMDGTEGVFHGAGREDVDARMLGDGRPFVIEVKHPRSRRPDPDELTETINEYADGSVEVGEITLVDHRMVERVKEHDASKTYRMRVSVGAPVSADAVQAAVEALDGATVEQRTPNRVSHRRADRVRTREAYSVSGTRLDDRHVELEIHGEGGLYVKEFVSGDEGRTTPSLAGELGVEATVTELDVVEVTGETAPFLTDSYRVD